MIAVGWSVLAYAVNRFAPEHRRAIGVIEGLANGERPWAVPWSELHEFVGFVTHPHAVARPLGLEDAWGFVRELLASPGARPLGAGPGHAAAVAEALALAKGGDASATGLETAALLREHGVRELLSADRSMRRFPFLTVIDPAHGEAWTPDARPEKRYRVLTPRGG